MEDITYANLVTKIGMNDLTPGEQYRITDYQTVSYIYVYTSAYPQTLTNSTALNYGTGEPIIVTALTDTILSAEAKSEDYPGDTIYYTIDNVDAGLFASTTGTILRRVDNLHRLDMPYDFRGIIVKLNSTNYTSLPDGSYNVRIGITSATDTRPFAYTETVPILIISGAQDVNIDVVSDTNGFLAAHVYGVNIGICARYSFSGGALKELTAQYMDLVDTTDVSPITSFFVGGSIENEYDGGTPYHINNPNMYSTDPKMGIPGGFLFVVDTSTSDITPTHA